MNDVVFAEPPSVLDPIRHQRLINDIDHIAAIAGINVSFIKQSMLTHCDSAEVDYVTNFRLYRESVPGFLIVGKPDVGNRCNAMAGALVRNFIDARSISLIKLLDAAEGGSVPDPTVLFVSNFYMNSYGKTLPAWKVAAIYDLLLQRQAENKPTVLGMDNYDAMKQSYGSSISDLLKKYKGQTK